MYLLIEFQKSHKLLYVEIVIFTEIFKLISEISRELLQDISSEPGKHLLSHLYKHNKMVTEYDKHYIASTSQNVYKVVI